MAAATVFPRSLNVGFAASAVAAAGGLAAQHGTNGTALDVLRLLPAAHCKAMRSFKKHHELGAYSVPGVFAPKNLAFVVVKNFLINATPVINEYIQEVENQDKEWDGNGDMPPYPSLPDLHPTLWRSTRSVCRDLSVQVSRESMRGLVTKYIDEAIAWKILKTHTVSAANKVKRGMAGLELVKRMVRTTIITYIPYGVAELFVSQVLLLHGCLVESTREVDPGLLEAPAGSGSVKAWVVSQTPAVSTAKITGRQAKRFAKQSLANGVRVTMTMLGAGLGTATVAAVAPEGWTTTGASMGYLAGELAFGTLNASVLQLDAWAKLD